MNRATNEMRESGLNNDLGDGLSKALGDVYKEAPIGLCHFDTRLRFLHINDWLAKLNGVSVAHHLGRAIGDVLPEIAAGVESQLRHVIDTGEPILGGTVDAETPAQPGQIRNFRHNYFPIKDDDGTVVGVSCVVEEFTERKRAEEALRNSETLLRSFIDNSPSIIVLKDRNLRYKLVNKAFTRYHGVTQEEAVGKTAHDISPKEYADWAIDHDREVLDSRSVVQKEKEYPYDGGYRTNFQVKFPVLDTTGNLIGVGGIATDITERKRTEEALRLSEERFKDFADAASDWFWEQDASLRFTYASPGVHEKLGVRASDYVGKTRRDIVELGVSDEQWRRHDANLAAHRQFRDFTFQRHDPTGQLRDFSIDGKPVFDAKGRFKGYRGVARDITKHKRAEEKFRALLESVPEAVIIVNEDGKIVLVNAQSERLFGYDRQDLLGRDIEQLMPVSARVRHRERRRDYCLDPHVRTMAVEQELVGKSKYGREFPVEISLGLIRTDEGMLISAIVRDITGRKRAEDLQRQAHKMEALGTLAGGIAHDFNNALFPIIALTELTLEKLPKDSVEARHLDKVRSAAYHARGLVRQILAFSRHEPLERRPIDLCPVVDEACELLRAGLPATVQIRKRLDEPSALVLADPIQIRQVILNLGANAGDAMAEEGGILTVELSEFQIGPDNGQIRTELTPGRYVRVIVTDTGRGIDQDKIERIFDPFFTTKEVGHGTGLGLSVVHGIVKNYGGTITVQSEPGKGSTFAVLFPVLEKSIDETGEPDLDTEGIGPCPEDRRNVAPKPRANPSDRLQTPDR